VKKLSPPAGWALTSLGEACTVVGGATPDTTEPTFWGDDVPWLTPADLAAHPAKYVAGGARGLTALGYRSSSAQMLPAGSVLFSSRAPIGHVAINTVPLCTNQGFKSLVPEDGVNVEYLYWYMRWATPLIRSVGSGTTFAEVSGKVMRSVPLLLPPPDEQARIAGRLDDLRSQMDRVDLSLSKVEQRLRAFERRLLTDLASAGEVRPLEEYLVEPLRNGFSARAVQGGDGVPVYSISAVTRRDFSEHYLKPTTVTQKRARGLFCEPGDIFVQRSNTPDLVGSAALYTGPAGKAIFPDLLIRVRVTDAISPAFLDLYMRTPSVRSYFQGSAQGLAGSMPKISQGTVGALPVPVLPRGEQERLAREVTALLDRSAAVRGQLSELRRRLGRLWEAALADGMAGMLVPRSSSGDTAECVLERIAAERATRLKTGRRSSSRRRKTTSPDSLDDRSEA
jgi:type I restriction enzyme S subunit